MNSSPKRRGSAEMIKNPVFSVISAVYNAGEYLEPMIASIIAQDIGFEENIELILVDDGSTDGSDKVLTAYEKMYPRNIRVVRKANGGVSSARNAGLALFRGKYVNFCDPDDTMSPNTFSEVLRFFHAHESECDVAAIPVVLFGEMVGNHILNDKFSRGTRVIDLRAEPQAKLLQVATAFFTARAAKKMHFNEKLRTAEDADVVQRILSDKFALGVVTGVRYNYRKHSDSALGKSKKTKEWYLSYLEHFVIAIENYMMNKLGYVPDYVQHVLMYDLGWKFRMEDIPDGVLTEDEERRFFRMLRQALRYISDDIILANKRLAQEYKSFILNIKYGEAPKREQEDGNVYYAFPSGARIFASRGTLDLDFATRTESGLLIEGKYAVNMYLPSSGRTIYLCVGERLIPLTEKYREVRTRSLGRTVAESVFFSVEIPDGMISTTRMDVSFIAEDEDAVYTLRSVVPGKFFPIGNIYRHGYKILGNTVLTGSKSAPFAVRKRKFGDGFFLELAYCSDLLGSKKRGAKKAVFARAAARMRKRRERLPLVLVSDRLIKGGDNGEAMFDYMTKNKAGEVHAVFAINSGDEYDRIAEHGEVVARESRKYKIMHLAADVIMSSHGDEFVINPFPGYSEPYRDILSDKKFIFLQHGITQANLTGWLKRENKNISVLVTAAKPEYRSFFDLPYHYTEENIRLTGFPRFDKLCDRNAKIITFMPTWRKYLMTDFSSLTGKWQEREGFCKSPYFRFYNALINDGRIIRAAKENGYTLSFMPHPNILPFIGEFDKPDIMTFHAPDDKYSDIYAESSLVITDYSSAAFDFAYMGKPVIYTQFDAEDFFSGEHIGTQGYFSYESDGFGEVEHDYDGAVERIIEYIENGCIMKDTYKERADRFFAFRDRSNCERVYAALCDIAGIGDRRRASAAKKS